MKYSNLLIYLFIFLLSACSDAPKLSALQQHDVILAFGDSLTQGVGASKEHSYPSVLSSISGIEVINAGISGETTQEGLQRLSKVIEQHNPTIMILLEGGNDILQNKNPKDIQFNLDEMITIAKSYGVQVVLIGVPEKNLFSTSAPFYKELADKHQLVFAPSIVSKLMKTPEMKSDYVHFNKTGYAAMAKSIHQLLKDNGAF